MKPAMSSVLVMLGFGFLSAAPALADSAPLPAFISPTGEARFSQAVQERDAAVSARRAAEVISSKFSEVTTGSIATNEDARGSTSAATPGHRADSPAPRAIVLASNRSVDMKSTRVRETSKPTIGTDPHRLPHNAKTKPALASAATLAALGQKVGWFNKLTNPAFW